MKFLAAAFFLLLSPATAIAQSAPPIGGQAPVTTAFERLSSTLGRLIFEIEQKTDIITQLQARNAELERQLAARPPPAAGEPTTELK